MDHKKILAEMSKRNERAEIYTNKMLQVIAKEFSEDLEQSAREAIINSREINQQIKSYANGN